MNRMWTAEEKACKQIADIVSDLRLDTRLVGTYLGQSEPVEILNRIVVMVDGMYESREQLRRLMGEQPSDIPVMDLIDESLPVEGSPTTFMVRCNILSELWTGYSNDEEYESFFNINDIGLPLAFMISEGYVAGTEKAKDAIDETWDALMEKEGLEDKGFSDLADIFDAVAAK